ncbi:hypothetical protein N9L19_00075 [bacterium]|nr:hypothetical protein [bacterium]
MANAQLEVRKTAQKLAHKSVGPQEWAQRQGNEDQWPIRWHAAPEPSKREWYLFHPAADQPQQNTHKSTKPRTGEENKTQRLAARNVYKRVRGPLELGSGGLIFTSLVHSETTAGWLSGEGGARHRTLDAERATTRTLATLDILLDQGWHLHLTYATVWIPRETKTSADALATLALNSGGERYWRKPCCDAGWQYVVKKTDTGGDRARHRAGRGWLIANRDTQEVLIMGAASVVVHGDMLDINAEETWAVYRFRQTLYAGGTAEC